MSDDDKTNDVGPVAQHQSIVKDESGFIPQYINALKEVITAPRQFFANLPETGSMIPPAVFLGVTCLLSALALGLAGRGLGSVPHIIIFAALGNYFMGLFSFLLFKLFGGKGTLQGTVRVANYSIAPAIVSWIPMAGFLAGLYSCFLLSLGLQKVHQVSNTKSLALTFGPFVAFSIFMAIVSKLGHFGH